MLGWKQQQKENVAWSSSRPLGGVMSFHPRENHRTCGADEQMREKQEALVGLRSSALHRSRRWNIFFLHCFQRIAIKHKILEMSLLFTLPWGNLQSVVKSGIFHTNVLKSNAELKLLHGCKSNQRKLLQASRGECRKLWWVWEAQRSP